jgi:hypothetical protein
MLPREPSQEVAPSHSQLEAPTWASRAEVPAPGLEQGAAGGPASAGTAAHWVSERAPRYRTPCRTTRMRRLGPRMTRRKLHMPLGPCTWRRLGTLRT